MLLRALFRAWWRDDRTKACELWFKYGSRGAWGRTDTSAGRDNTSEQGCYAPFDTVVSALKRAIRLLFTI